MPRARFLRSTLVLATFLFVAANLLFAWAYPLDALGRISAYNVVFPGRERLPYGERPDLAYNLSLFNLEAMFAAHEAAAPKGDDEFRVILIGDSSTWGFLLRPEETLGALLDGQKLTANDRRVRFYNLGYPTMSVTKDLLMLEKALHYQPDLIVWLTTLESLPREKQLASPILQNNAAALDELNRRYGLDLDTRHPALVRPTFWQRTVIGQRRALADLIRLQAYGVLWAATGIDQFYPETYEPPQSDLEAGQDFHGLQPPTLHESDLAWNVLAAGVQMAGEVPILFVNEPIYRSQGQNSDIRYNFFYPRWAYDAYRQQFSARCQAHNWRCLDAWDLVPAGEFSNSAIHRTPAGENLLAGRLGAFLQEWIDER
ncbi:MAG: hypothetical protein ACOYYS_08455 [Chloroflexota bacterium]